MKVSGTVELSRVVMELDDPQVERVVVPGAFRVMSTEAIEKREYVPADNTVSLFTDSGWVDLPADARVTVTIEIDDSTATDGVGFDVDGMEDGTVEEMGAAQ